LTTLNEIVDLGREHQSQSPFFRGDAFSVIAPYRFVGIETIMWKCIINAAAEE
jgi:hypothetical protein